MLDEIGGHIGSDALALRAASGEATTSFVAPNEPLSLPATIDLIAALQKRRTFCIKQQMRMNNATGAFVRTMLGWRMDLPEKERAKIAKQAAAIVKAVEGGGDQRRLENRDDDVPAAAAPIILASAQARATFDAMRTEAEREMRKLGRALPVSAWAAEVKGFGELGLAILVAETGDLANYSGPAKVWKRLGLAVIAGERQRKKANVEEAAAHAYNPRRRAEIWALADSMFKHQWRGEKTDKETGEVTAPHAVGPYGEDYGRKKAEYLAREGWMPAHADNAARRYMAKSLVKDLWRAWRREARCALAPTFPVPPAAHHA